MFVKLEATTSRDSGRDIRDSRRQAGKIQIQKETNLDGWSPSVRTGTGEYMNGRSVGHSDGING